MTAITSHTSQVQHGGEAGTGGCATAPPPCHYWLVGGAAFTMESLLWFLAVNSPELFLLYYIMHILCGWSMRVHKYWTTAHGVFVSSYTHDSA